MLCLPRHRTVSDNLSPIRNHRRREAKAYVGGGLSNPIVLFKQTALYVIIRLTVSICKGLCSSGAHKSASNVVCMYNPNVLKYQVSPPKTVENSKSRGRENSP